MVVGLPSSSSSSPAAAALILLPPLLLLLRHEEAQAADRSTRLPQLLQQEAQIGQQDRDRSAQRGSGHHADAQRAAGTGEATLRGVGCLSFCLKSDVKLGFFYHVGKQVKNFPSQMCAYF